MQYAVTSPMKSKHGKIYGQDTIVYTMIDLDFIDSFDFVRNKKIKSKERGLERHRTYAHNPEDYAVFDWAGSKQWRTFDKKIDAITWKVKAIEEINVHVIKKAKDMFEKTTSRYDLMQRNLQMIKNEYPEYFL